MAFEKAIVELANHVEGKFQKQKIQGFFKDFQAHISHFSRTPFSAKESLDSMSFFYHNMSNFIPKVFLCLLLFLWSST